MFLRWGVVSTLSNTQAGGPPLVGRPQLLIQCICSYPPYWRPFLHPQPKDPPCRGDRDPLITGNEQDAQNNAELYIKRMKTTWKTFEGTIRWG